MGGNRSRPNGVRDRRAGRGAAVARTAGGSGEVESHKEWLVSCRDVAGRRRDLAVFVDQGHVVLVAPPGETAVLAPLEVGRLRAALRDAVMDATTSDGS